MLCDPKEFVPLVPSRYTLQGRNIEEIVSEWSSELEKHTAAFVKHASALAAWDRHILSNRHALLEVGSL